TLEEDFYFDYGAEEITDYQDPSELLAALKQKEEEVILAAQLGNALLLENRQLKEQSDKLHEQFTDKLELQELEQGRHELRLKLEGCQSHWESQVGELERDVRELSAQVEQLTQALSEAERDKGRLQLEHGEQTQRLREELRTAMEVERAMSSELQALKQELQQKGGHNRQQDEELISAMKEQVLRLTQKEQELERRLESVSQENAELRASLASLQTRLAQHNQLDEQHSQQKNLMEAELVRSKNDMMCLNNQLLDAIQRKLELSQELEAWQDDIQIVINQQLKSQQQTEQPQKKPTSNGLAFFRRPSRTASTWTRQLSPSSSWSSDSNTDKVQAPWREW
uniref:Si:ch211-235m3.5 n=1 Tax=Poecilia reticulata TaxID=8081 RepID=A0A3P9QEZ5_POERE